MSFVNFLYDIQHFNPVTNALETLRVSTKGFITTSLDTPASTPYLKRIKANSAGDFSTFMFDRGATYGKASVGTGEIILVNADRKYDDLREHDFRRIIIRRVFDTRGSLNDEDIIATFDIDSVSFTWTELRINIRDRLSTLDTQMQTATFAGNNADSFAIEGDESLEGRVKPVLIGAAGWSEPPLGNTASLLCIVNHDANGNPAPIGSIDGVKDNGVDIAFDKDYATLNALISDQQAGQIPSGRYATCLAEGAFAMNNLVSDGTITCLASEEASQANMSAAQAVVSAVTRFSDSVVSDFVGISDTDAINDSVVGIYVDNEITLFDVTQDLVASIGGYLVPTSLGKLKLGVLQDPASNAPSATFKKDVIIRKQRGGLERITFSDESDGFPVNKVVVEYKKYSKTLTESEVAGVVTTEERQDLKREFRKVTEDDPSVLNTYKNSKSITLKTLLRERSQAVIFANEQLVLRNVWRDQWELPVVEDTNLDLADVIEVKLDAFDMLNGKKFVILGKTFNLNRNITTYSIYG